MILDDPIDKKYAKALESIFSDIQRLTPEEIDKAFHETGYRFFDDNSQPKNLMLQDIYTGVVFDELDPYFPGSNHGESLERYIRITNDFLAGNFYPSYFMLSGYYSNMNEGYTLTVKIEDSNFKLTSGNDDVTLKLREIISSIVLNGDDEQDLVGLSRNLPRHIGDLTLIYCDVEEYLIPYHSL